MNEGKQVYLDFNIDFNLIAKKKSDDVADKKQRFTGHGKKPGTKEFKHIFHKNCYDPNIRKAKSDKFREKVRERKKKKLQKLGSGKFKPGEKLNGNFNPKNGQDKLASGKLVNGIDLQGKQKTVKNIFPSGLLEDFPFLGSPESEEEVLSLFKLYDSFMGDPDTT